MISKNTIILCAVVCGTLVSNSALSSFLSTTCPGKVAVPSNWNVASYVTTNSAIQQICRNNKCSNCTFNTCVAGKYYCKTKREGNETENSISVTQGAQKIYCYASSNKQPCIVPCSQAPTAYSNASSINSSPYGVSISSKAKDFRYDCRNDTWPYRS